MNDWIPVIGTLGGALMGAFIAWRVEGLRHRFHQQQETRREKSHAYSVFLSAVYRFLATAQQVETIEKTTSWLTATRNLRYLETSGLAAAGTSAKDDFMLGYSLVLIWGSEPVKSAAKDLLKIVQTSLESVNEEEGMALIEEVATRRDDFVAAVHEDLGLVGGESH